MNKTWFEQGEEKGIEKGRRDFLREQIEDRFGPLPPRVVERLQQMPLTELIPLGKRILRAQSLSDLGLDKLLFLYRARLRPTMYHKRLVPQA